MASPGKGTSNIEHEVLVLDVGNVALSNGDVIDLSDRSAGLKSPPELIVGLKSPLELIGAPWPPKKFKLTEGEAHRATMVNQLKVRLLTSVT